MPLVTYMPCRRDGQGVEEEEKKTIVDLLVHDIYIIFVSKKTGTALRGIRIRLIDPRNLRPPIAVEYLSLFLRCDPCGDRISEGGLIIGIKTGCRRGERGHYQRS